MDRRKFLETMVLAASVVSSRSAFTQTNNESPALNKGIVPQRTLGRTGMPISALILGGVVAMKEPPTAAFHPAELAHAALDAGITYFDTAPAYGNGQSELNYGEVLSTRRQEVFLASKTGSRDYDGAMRDVEASLKRLRTDHLDLLQIHGVTTDEDIPRWGRKDGVYLALLKLKDEKVTRFIGVTGHDSAEKMKQAIETFEFDTILTTFNPTQKRRPFEQIVLPVAQEKNMGIIAMKVMGGGLGSLAEGNPIKNDGASNHDESKHQANPTGLLRYVLGLPIAAAVIGMASLDHLKTNLQAVREYKPMNQQEREQLQRLMA